MALTKEEIKARRKINQDKSDTKRGVKMTGFKLHQDIIALLNELSEETGLSKTAIVSEGIKLFAQIKRG